MCVLLHFDLFYRFFICQLLLVYVIVVLVILLSFFLFILFLFLLLLSFFFNFIYLFIFLLCRYYLHYCQFDQFAFFIRTCRSAGSRTQQTCLFYTDMLVCRIPDAIDVPFLYGHAGPPDPGQQQTCPFLRADKFYSFIFILSRYNLFSSFIYFL